MSLCQEQLCPRPDTCVSCRVKRQQNSNSNTSKLHGKWQLWGLQNNNRAFDSYAAANATTEAGRSIMIRGASGSAGTFARGNILPCLIHRYEETDHRRQKVHEQWWMRIHPPTHPSIHPRQQDYICHVWYADTVHRDACVTTRFHRCQTSNYG